MSDSDHESDPVDSPIGWVHPMFGSDPELAREDAPGNVCRQRSERIERTSPRWCISTLASCYRLDLRDGTVVRTERGGPDRVAVDLGLVPHNQLPGDGTPVRLWAVLDCRLAEPMVLLLDLAGDGRHATFRVTTPVVAIHPAPGPDEPSA